MLTEYLSLVEGVETYPIVSLFIFIPFFLAVTVFIFRLKKDYISYMSRLPLDGTQDNSEGETSWQ